MRALLRNKLHACRYIINEIFWILNEAIGRVQVWIISRLLYIDTSRGTEFINKTWIKIWTVLNEEIKVEVDNNVRPDNNKPTQLKAKLTIENSDSPACLLPRWSRNCFIDCFINFFIGQAVKSLRYEPLFPPLMLWIASWSSWSALKLLITALKLCSIDTQSSHVTDFNQSHAWIFYSERRLLTIIPRARMGYLTIIPMRQ